MPITQTPWDQRIQRLRETIKDKDGPSPHLRQKLIRARQKQFQHRQENRPIPSFEDTQYETDIGRLGRDLQLSQSDIAGRRQAVEQQFGFGQDQSNPFSVAKQLEENYRTQQGTTLGSYARQGQLYAGSLNNAQMIDRRGFEQGLDTSQRDYQARLAELSQKELQAQNVHQSGTEQARIEALERAINAPLDPDETPEPPPFKQRAKQAQLRARIQKQRKQGNTKRVKTLRKRLKQLRGK